ncbi:Protein of unknown function [Streptococcus thermophilus]|nr:Protein of unknown function [Streptococcus thermophilus]
MLFSASLCFYLAL